MGNFLHALKRGYQAAFGPQEYEVEGKQVQCSHCGNQTFAEGSAQLNTVGLTFLGLDWANKSATTLMCSACGRIEWFGQRPSKL